MPQVFRSCRLAACVLAGSLAASVAVAEPLNRQWVDANATWLMHIDVEAAKNSSIGRYVLDHAEQLHLNLDGMKSMRECLGVDPIEDVRSITMYGVGDDDGRTVGLFVLSREVDTVIDRINTEAGTPAEEIEVDGRVFRVWEMPDERIYAYTREMTPGERWLVVAGVRSDQIDQAVDVVDGHALNLDLAPEPVIEANPKAGSVLFGVVSDLRNMAKVRRDSVVAQRADAFQLDMGELSGEAFCRMLIHTESNEDATHIASFMQGLISAGILMSQQDPEKEPLRRLALATRVEADGASLSVSISFPTQEIIDALRDAAEQQKKM
ncbi:MAG: hypothetical protein ACF8PN_11975 [Phycisphaerales bacterium]